ncbi:MAG: hypothetical protein JSW71_04325, partial [Gemmatimonadota bacterium]
IEGRPPKLKCPADYPAGFTGWVMKLLEKAPAQRYRRCADAAAALTELAAPSGERASVQAEAAVATTAISLSRSGAVSDVDWRTPERPRRPFKLIGAGLRLFGVRTVPIVDRDSERDLLWGMFRLVAERQRPALVVVEGSPGTGKSRLAEWLWERTHEMGLADCLKAEHGRAAGRDSGLSHMLAAAWSCSGIGAEELRKRVTSILDGAGIKSRTSRRSVTELLAPAALGDDYNPGMFYQFRSRAARFSALFEVLRRVYHEKPLVVWMDDVHFGTDVLHFTRYLMERSQAEPIPLLAVLTARDDLLVESSEASQLIRELCRGENARCMRLEPLSDTDSRELVSNLLYLEGDLAVRVSHRSGGNPLYATQLVGDWVERGTLEAGASGFVLAGAARPEIPDDVHSVWVQRLERVLDATTLGVVPSRVPVADRMQMQVVLELAAALSGKVAMAEWLSLCSLAGVTDPGPALESLLASRMAHTGSDGWSFSHSMLRDSIERIAREKRRWASHNRLCADMLEQLHPVPHWGDSERIGRHRFEAEQFEAAVRPLLRGARERVRLEEYSAALLLLARYDRALDRLDSPKDDSRRLEGWLLRADIHCTRRELREAEELANRVRALASTSDKQQFEGVALLVLARVHRHQGNLRSALDEYLAAQAELRFAGPKQKLATCLSEQAHTMLELGLLDGAWQAFNHAQEIYEEIGQLVPWAENQLGLARVVLGQKELDHALALCSRVRGFAAREGLSGIEATACAIEAESQIAAGQLADAERSLDKSVELFERLGLTRQALHPRLLKIMILLESGSVDRARLEFGQLRTTPEVNTTRITRLLLSCVGLAVAVDGPAHDFETSLSETAELLEASEVLTSDVERCLLLAQERAGTMGFPDRATRISRVGADQKRTQPS